MSGNIIILNASQVVTCSGFSAKGGKEMSNLSIIPDGAVVVENGTITFVGAQSEVEDSIDTDHFTVVDASNRSVLPGFVDSHTHFVFGGDRAEEFSWRLRGDSYMDIMKRGGGIYSTVKATRETSEEDLTASARRRLDTMLSFGVTTVEGKSGYGLDLETEIKQLEVMQQLNQNHAIDIVPTFLGAHAIPPEFKHEPDMYIEFIIDNVLPVIANNNLALFCDIFCEQDVFSIAQSRKLLKEAKSYDLGVKFHADEIVCIGGAELAAELGAVSADHLLQASDKGIKALAQAGVVATLLPGTAFSLREPYARGRYMIDNQCAIALATDLNPGSCYTESIPLIMALATLNMNLTIEEALTAFTINGAAALSLQDSIGSLDVGKQGDIIILEHPSYHFIPYHMGVNTVETVIKNGRIVFSRDNQVQ